jgi:hypothetical protein
VDRSEIVHEVSEKLSGEGAETVSLTADLEEYGDCSTVMVQAQERLGRIDIPDQQRRRAINHLRAAGGQARRRGGERRAAAARRRRRSRQGRTNWATSSRESLPASAQPETPTEGLVKRARAGKAASWW